MANKTIDLSGVGFDETNSATAISITQSAVNLLLAVHGTVNGANLDVTVYQTRGLIQGFSLYISIVFNRGAATVIGRFGKT